MVMEINGLQYKGEGLIIKDPSKVKKDKVKVTGEMDLCQLVISLETQQIEDNVYPFIKLKEVAFTMSKKPGS